MTAPAPPRRPPSVLFVCVANACRSQMAEAFARALVGERWEIWSAGSRPAGQVHPVAIQLMEEVGLDLRSHRSKGLDAVPPRTWDVLVTMGCGDACPQVPAQTRLDWDIADPVGRRPEEARGIRDDLRRRVETLLMASPPGRD